MHPAHRRRLKHEGAEAQRAPVEVFRNGKRIGIVRPRVLGFGWSAECDGGPMLGGLYGNVLDAELAIVRWVVERDRGRKIA